MSLENRLDSGVYGKLSALRGALRAHLIGRGLCWLVLGLVAAVFLTLAADYTLRLDRAQRGLIMGLVLAGLAYVVWRWLIRPMRVPMNDEEMALVMEQYHPELGDRLISALQFVGNPASRIGASETLIGKVIDQANELARRTSAGSAVAGGGTWKRTAWPAAALLALAVFASFNSQLMYPWLMRNLFLSNMPYPRQTVLEIVGGPEFRVVRGDDLTITCIARFDHVVPETVTFHMDFPSIGKVDEVVPRATPGGNEFHRVFEGVSDGFTFHVTGNDDRTERCSVSVGARPELADVTFALNYPAYMGREPTVITAEHGVLPVPAGSAIVLNGRATKPLASAVLMLNDQPAVELRIVPTPGADGRDRHGLEGTLQLPERIESPTLMLRFVLKDVEGIDNPRGAAYSLRIDPDNAPTVTLGRRAVRGEVTANAVVPLIVGAHDDYGVSGLGVLAALVIDPPTATQPEGPEIVLPDIPAGQKNVQAEYAMNLADMKLQVGQLLRVQATGRDTLPASFGGPNSARSVVQTFKIVSREELEEELLRRQREVREDFARTVLTQADIRNKIKGARDRVAGVGVDAEVSLAISDAAGEQRRVAAQCAVAVQQLQAILDEMQANRAGTPEDQRKIAVEVIAPLEEISKKPMNDLADSMDRASKEKDRGKLKSFSDDAVAALDGLYNRMEEILKAMKQIESRQELANRLKSLIGVAETIQAGIRELENAQGAKIFDATTKPTTGPKPGPGK